MSDLDLKSFLLESEYCDFKNPDIQKLAQQITGKYENPKDKAVALFYWVRDNVHYRVGLWNRKASETLAERSGSCTNNANLLVSLLRSVDIPAGYNVMRVKGQELFGLITPPTFKKRISEKAVHIYAQAYINGKWVKCDPSVDVHLSEKTSHFNSQSKLVDWDGEKDALLNLDQAHILEEKHLLPNIDNMISKKPHTAKGIVIEVANLYIKFLRESPKMTIHHDELEASFKQWLKKYSLRHHILYSLNSHWHDLKAKFRRST